MMVVTVRLLVTIFLALSASTLDAYSPVVSQIDQVDLHPTNDPLRNPQVNAFQVLENKCNVCHRKRNRRRVFTKENMDAWSSDIYTQVFVKKRMPKGNNIKLNSNEYQDLLTWITSTKTSKNGNQL
jgi:uncharacterized membrane protein